VPRHILAPYAQIGPSKLAVPAALTATRSRSARLQIIARQFLTPAAVSRKGRNSARCAFRQRPTGL